MIDAMCEDDDEELSAIMTQEASKIVQSLSDVSLDQWLDQRSSRPTEIIDIVFGGDSEDEESGWFSIEDLESEIWS